LNAYTGDFVGRKRTRGRLAIVIALAVCGLVLPGRADAHGTANVIALDYEARLPAGGVVTPGVRARVLDGDRKLELTVDPPRTVIVRGYGDEPFLRFSRRGAEVNLDSPTAVADKLTPRGAIPVMSLTAPPRWSLLTSGHRLTWHDHRLGPRPGGGTAVRGVAEWSIPIVVDGSPRRIEGELWRAGKPAIWPWLLVWLVSLAAAVAVARLAPRPVRRGIVYVACATCALLVLFVSAGFGFASARTGLTRWLDLAVPVAIAVGAVTVFSLRSRRRLAVAAIVGGFAFAAALGDVSVLRHGFVVSALPAQIVRGGVALALAAGALALLVALLEFWRGEPEEGHPPKPRPRPQMAIPRGRAR
jgi:hypothetical protein